MPPSAIQWDVFASHANQQKRLVRTIVDHLRQSCALGVFFDEDDVRPGCVLKDEINRGLNGSRKVVFFVSPDSVHRA